MLLKKKKTHLPVIKEDELQKQTDKNWPQSNTNNKSPQQTSRQDHVTTSTGRICYSCGGCHPLSLGLGNGPVDSQHRFRKLGAWYMLAIPLPGRWRQVNPSGINFISLIWEHQKLCCIQKQMNGTQRCLWPGHMCVHTCAPACTCTFYLAWFS